MTGPHHLNVRKCLAAAALLGCVVLASQGCYEKVVGASGFGAGNVTIEKPDGPDTRPAKTFEYKKAVTTELPSPGSK